MPATATADDPGPPIAVGTVTSVTDGAPIGLGKGHAGRWLVGERAITISFDGGDPTVMTYHANVDLFQKGNFQGRMDFDGATLNVVGHSESAIPFGGIPNPGGNPDPIPLFLLAFHGNWAGVGGVQGHGTFSGQIVFVTDGQHILDVVPQASYVSLFGQMN
jgi:hypothetical protein